VEECIGNATAAVATGATHQFHQGVYLQVCDVCRTGNSGYHSGHFVTI
jgi:hypothetical protein